MVPFVKGRVRVKALVTLEADEICVERGGQRASDLRLAAARFSFDQERLPHTEREVHGHPDRTIRNVLLFGKPFEYRLDAVHAPFFRHDFLSAFVDRTAVAVLNVWPTTRFLLREGIYAGIRGHGPDPGGGLFHP